MLTRYKLGPPKTLSSLEIVVERVRDALRLESFGFSFRGIFIGMPGLWT